VARAYPAPRWQTPLPASVVGSWGPLVAETARLELGIQLDRWQRRALNRALAYDAAGRLVHRLYLISTARQNGKTALVRALIVWYLTSRRTPEWAMALGLAHDRKQAALPYRAVLADLEPIARRVGPLSRGGLALTRYLGIRSAMYGRHREYHTGSREARDAIRGESVDLGLFDEVRTQRDFDTWAALEPTTTARPDPLIVAISTAGSDRSVLLRSWFDRGLRIIAGAEPPAGFGMTWYAPPDDADTDSPATWRLANPSIADGRMDPARILEARSSLGPLAFRSERLNLWTEAIDEWLPAGLWQRLEGPQPARTGARVVLGIEAAPSWRRLTVTVVLMDAAGLYLAVAGELDASRTASVTIAPAELVALVAELVAAWRPESIAYSKAAASGPHIEAYADAAGVRAVPLGSRELRSASAMLRAELIGGRITHAADPLLAQQVRAARPSADIESGDWYLSVRESAGDIDAIRAAAWATWAILAPPEQSPPRNIHV